MKKQLLLAATFMAAILGANAQTWTFESLPDGNVNSSTDQSSLNGLVINTSTDKLWTVATKEAEFNGVAYTKQLKSNGGDRSLTFPVTGPGTIEVVALSANSDEAVRTYSLGSEVLSTNAEGTVVSMEYKGAAGNLTLNTNGGINFYSIKYTANGETPIIANILWNMADVPGEKTSFSETKNFSGLVIIPGIDPDGKTLTMTTTTSTKSFKWKDQKTKFGQLKANGDSKIQDNMPTARILKFKPTSEGTITFGALTGSNGQDRNAIVSKYNNGTLTELLKANTNIVEGDKGYEPFSTDYAYTSGDEIWIYADSNIAYYFIHFSGSIDDKFNGSGDNPSGISANHANKAIVATEYYNIAGIKLSAPSKGLNLVKNVMEDGSVEVVKVYVK